MVLVRKRLKAGGWRRRFWPERWGRWRTTSVWPSVKVGVVTLEADSSALFQELESFQRQKLLDAFRQAGMKVHEVRVTLGQ